MTAQVYSTQQHMMTAKQYFDSSDGPKESVSTQSAQLQHKIELSERSHCRAHIQPPEALLHH